MPFFLLNLQDFFFLKTTLHLYSSPQCEYTLWCAWDHVYTLKNTPKINSVLLHLDWGKGGVTMSEAKQKEFQSRKTLPDKNLEKIINLVCFPYINTCYHNFS